MIIPVVWTAQPVITKRAINQSMARQQVPMHRLPSRMCAPGKLSGNHRQVHAHRSIMKPASTNLSPQVSRLAGELTVARTPTGQLRADSIPTVGNKYWQPPTAASAAIPQWLRALATRPLINSWRTHASWRVSSETLNAQQNQVSSSQNPFLFNNFLDAIGRAPGGH
jgi:hypothetical protein